MQKLWLLSVSFAIIGIGAYGGGIVTVPLMQHELVKNHAYLTMDEMAKIVSLAQITPGPIAVNAATFVGYRVAGLGGALLASTVVVLPAILILAIVLHVQDRTPSNPHFLRLRRGLRAGVLSLLLFATWSYGRDVVTNRIDLLIAVVTFLVLTIFEKKVHPLIVIVGSGVVSLLFFGQ